MDRATKLLVVGWACAALFAQAWLLQSSGALPQVAAAVFLASFALTAWDERAIAVVLAFTYVFPAVIWLFLGTYHVYFAVVWMAALLGGIAPASVRSHWNIPAVWRAPLVCWALVIIVGASIVIARELDFTPSLIHVGTISNSVRGGWPSFVIRWILHVSLTLVLGILWFDWLFGSSVDFRVVVIAPLALSCAAMAAVASFQLFVDVRFLNPTVFAGLGRASGTVFDANVCGTVAALWTGGVVLCAERLGRWRRPALIVGGVLAWLTVWASGSRTAFAAATIIAGFSLAMHLARADRRRLTASQIMVGLAAVGVLVVIVNVTSGVVGPVRRVWDTLPGLSAESILSFAAEMWNRNGYGSTSTRMISEFPWFGVGVGSFHLLLPDFSLQYGGYAIARDNAQNWYRHQLVEFGVIGSLGWILWVVAFGSFVIKRRRLAPAVATVGRGVLIAFAAICFLGMPAQDVIASITFWTIAFWYVLLVGRPGSAAPLTLRSWVPIASVVVVFAIGTADLAATRLRVPVRAQRFGWPYSYGLYAAEPDGAGGEQRWTGRRSVAVLEAPTRWIALTLSIDHLGLDSRGGRRGAAEPIRPVDVKVWRDGEAVLKAHLTNTESVTNYIHIPKKRVLLETWTSRVFRPADLGVPGDQELGMLMRWSFVDKPPDTARGHAGEFD